MRDLPRSGALRSAGVQHTRVSRSPVRAQDPAHGGTRWSGRSIRSMRWYTRAPSAAAAGHGVTSRRGPISIVERRGDLWVVNYRNGARFVERSGQMPLPPTSARAGRRGHHALQEVCDETAPSRPHRSAFDTNCSANSTGGCAPRVHHCPLARGRFAVRTSKRRSPRLHADSSSWLLGCVPAASARARGGRVVAAAPRSEGARKRAAGCASPFTWAFLAVHRARFRFGSSMHGDQFPSTRLHV